MEMQKCQCHLHPNDNNFSSHAILHIIHHKSNCQCKSSKQETSECDRIEEHPPQPSLISSAVRVVVANSCSHKWEHLYLYGRQFWGGRAWRKDIEEECFAYLYLQGDSCGIVAVISDKDIFQYLPTICLHRFNGNNFLYSPSMYSPASLQKIFSPFSL